MTGTYLNFEDMYPSHSRNLKMKISPVLLDEKLYLSDTFLMETTYGQFDTINNRYEQFYTIKNRFGLHIRPSTALSAESRHYKSEITITYRDNTVNAKSIIELLTLGVAGGEEILVTGIGEDCKEAVEAIGRLIERRFDLVEERNE